MAKKESIIYLNHNIPNSQYKDMKKAIKANKVKEITILSLDRISSDEKEQQDFKDLCKKTDTKLVILENEECKPSEKNDENTYEYIRVDEKRKIFDLESVLSITADKLLTTNIYKVYEILSYLLAEDIITIGIPTAIKIARPYIFEKYPELLNVKERPIKNENDLEKWLKKQIKIYGNYFELTPIPKDYNVYKFFLDQ